MSANKRIILGILAHVDAGKTTLSEAVLYRTGEIRKPGRVDHGDTLLDDDSIERNRGITIFSRQAGFSIGETADVTLIDTPGHVDFAAETERSLSVIDYALLVVSGSEGVQAHTRTLYSMLQERKIPVFIFVNKMDIAVRAKEDIVAELAEELGAGAVDFSGAGISGHAVNDALNEFSDEFIDGVTLHSSALAEKVLEDEPLNDEDIARAVSRREIVPCMFGSALKMQGIDELLEVIGRFTVQPEYGSEFGARVYKVVNAEDGERLCFIKVTGGELRVREKIGGCHAEKGENIIEAGTAGADSSGKSGDPGRAGGTGRSAGYDGPDRPGDSGSLEGSIKEFDWEDKVNQIRIYSGSRFRTAESAPAGTAVAVTGLSRAMPGDGIGAELPLAGRSIRPFMVYTVTGPEGRDPYLVMKDLEKLAQEDPALSIRWRADTSEIEIRLMGQVQLEVLQAIIKERFGYDVSFGQGSVLYLETIDGVYEGVGHFEPLRHYAEVHLIIEPGERGSGVVITSVTPEDELARNWQRLIMTHLEEKEHAGVLTGSPLTDVRISLAAGRAHPKHTNGGDFREATYRAIRNALMQARRDGRAVLLEPWTDYDIRLPAGSVGRAMTDIKQMGGTQDELEQTADSARIRGRVPASEIANYQQVLAGYTSGEGRLSCSPAGYEPCHDAEAVIERIDYDPEHDVDDPADSVFVNHSGSDIVKWDEVPQHMHIASVLLRRQSDISGRDGGMYGYTSLDDSGAYGASLNNAFAGDAKEREKRRIAAEKELRRIFERTYGPVKEARHRDARESDFRKKKPELSEEEAAWNAARNEEIRAKHMQSGGTGKTASSASSIKPSANTKGHPASSASSGTAARNGSRNATSRNEAEIPLILIDGYNLIFADQYLTELADRDVGSARDQLLERLCNYAAYTGCEMTVVFDAYKVPQGTGSEENFHGVKVIYTAENEPADIRMGLITGSLKKKEFYVVSSDSLVQQDAWGHGALRISSHEFMHLLADTEQEIRSRL